jgi:hypothetical protein
LPGAAQVLFPLLNFINKKTRSFVATGSLFKVLCTLMNWHNLVAYRHYHSRSSAQYSPAQGNSPMAITLYYCVL